MSYGWVRVVFVFGGCASVYSLLNKVVFNVNCVFDGILFGGFYGEWNEWMVN